ncbi:Rh154 [macacine betaherpesvirus 3]|nr:Rh154 [macacine betaherpesvirus 3]QQL11337.1 Rh154 [macacine betaherpesvirus 3]
MLRFYHAVYLGIVCMVIIMTVVYSLPFYSGDPLAPHVKVAYIYYNASNLTIYCNTSGRHSRFLAGGIMITTKYNTTFLKGGYHGYDRHPRPLYLKFVKVLDTAPYRFYLNSTVTCWGSNGTYGVRSFMVTKITNTSDKDAIVLVNDTDLVETPDAALNWWPRSQQNRVVMIVLLAQLVFVVFIINACLIWSCKFKRHN